MGLFDSLPNEGKEAPAVSGLFGHLPDEKPNDPGFGSALKRTAGQMAETAGVSAEDVFGKNAITQGLQDWGAETQAANPAGVQGFGDIASNPMLYVKESLANGLAQMGPQAVAGIAGRVIGGVGGALLAGPPGAAVGQEIVGRAAQALPTFIQEYGGIRKDQNDQGINDKLGAAAAAIPATAIEFGLGPQRLLSRFLEGAVTKELKDAAKGGVKDVAKFVGKEAVKSGAGEALEEFPQTLLETAGAHRNPFSAEAMGEGAFSSAMALPGGALMGAGMTGLNLRNANKENVKDDATKAAIAKQNAGLALNANDQALINASILADEEYQASLATAAPVAPVAKANPMANLVAEAPVDSTGANAAALAGDYADDEINAATGGYQQANTAQFAPVPVVGPLSMAANIAIQNGAAAAAQPVEQIPEPAAPVYPTGSQELAGAFGDGGTGKVVVKHNADGGFSVTSAWDKGSAKKGSSTTFPVGTDVNQAVEQTTSVHGGFKAEEQKTEAPSNKEAENVSAPISPAIEPSAPAEQKNQMDSAADVPTMATPVTEKKESQAAPSAPFPAAPTTAPAEIQKTAVDPASEELYKPLIERLIRNKRNGKERGFDVQAAITKSLAAMKGQKQMPGSFRSLANKAEKLGDKETAEVLRHIADLNDGRKSVKKEEKSDVAPKPSAQQTKQGENHGQEATDQAAQEEAQREAEKPAAVAPTRNYPQGQARMLAARMTQQGMPSEAYQHPSGDGTFAIRSAESTPAGAPNTPQEEIHGQGQETTEVLSTQPAEQSIASVQPKAPTKTTISPIMRRDDLVGAIMRVTGGKGISPSMADTLTGEKSNKQTKLRGLFTNAGQQDMDDLAMLLREEEGFDVRDGSHLEELIRSAASGDVAKSIARQEADKAADQEKQYRETIRSNAKKLGIKTVGVKFAQMESMVLKVLEQRHAKAVELLDARSLSKFNAAVDQANSLISEDVIDEAMADISRRGLKARDFWNETSRILRGMVYDARQEAANEQRQAESEAGIAQGDGRGTGSTGSGIDANQGDQAQPGQAATEEVAPALELAGQTPAEVRAQEAQRKADEVAAKREEIPKTPNVTVDQVDLFNTQGSVFDTPSASSSPATRKPFDSAALDKAREDTIKASKKSGAKHLDSVEPSVETMRGREIFYAHDMKQRGVIRTVDNRGNVYVNWADKYSADKELAGRVEEENKNWLKSTKNSPYLRETENGRTFVYQSSLGTTDLKDYVFADSSPAPKTLPERVASAKKKAGEVVGYVGEGPIFPKVFIKWDTGTETASTVSGLEAAPSKPTAEDEPSEPTETPAWHTQLPAEGLPITDAQKKSGGYQQVPYVLAEDAFKAITQDQLMSGAAMYAYYLPAADGLNGIVRLVPDDQTPPKPWTLLNGEAVRVYSQPKENIVAKLAGWLRSAPVLGEEKVSPKPAVKAKPKAKDTSKPSPGVYLQPTSSASLDGQMALAQRGSRIASLLLMNEQVRKINEASAYTESEINNAANENLDALQDWLSEVASKANPKKEAPAAEANATKSSTEDAGSELTYNRRNRLNRNLKWEDVADKNVALRIKEVVKAKVYLKPDYQAMIDSGVPPMAVHLVKQVYDSISIAPSIGRKAATDEDLQIYIQAVNRVMAATEAWASDNQAIAKWSEKNARVAGAMLGAATSLSDFDQSQSLLDVVYPGSWKDYRAEVTILGGNKLLGALQPGYDEAKRAIKDIEKGWPEKREAWQQQGYKVIVGNSLKAEFYEGRSPNHPYVSVWVNSLVGNRTLSVASFTVDGAISKDDPAVVKAAKDKVAELESKFILLNKANRNLGAFASQEEAEQAARDATKREAKETTIREEGHSVEASERIGPERRLEGENVSSDTLKTTFGFKGVNFGNWMKGGSPALEAERQLHLNHAYDSFLDLAEILNVPPKAVSLNGMLGLAIGAQGGGKNLAHFVPGVNEINLTRTGGAGALAHEFGHALDHYFATLAGVERNKEPYLSAQSGRPRMEQYVENGRAKLREVSLSTELRPEILAQFKTIVEAMTRRMQTQEEADARAKGMMTQYKKHTEGWLKSLRNDFSTGARPGAPNQDEVKASALATFDKLAKRVMDLDLGDGKIAIGQKTSVSPVVAEMRDAFKKAFDRNLSIESLRSLQSNIDAMKYQQESVEAGKKHEPQMVTTDYQSASAAADKGRQKPYWGTKLEMFARAFDAFVVDTLAGKAAKNTYLAGIEAVAPYGEERKAINRAFEALVGEIKTRETDSGVAMFNQATDGRITAADKAIYGMAAEGKSAAEILKFIASASRNPFYRQLAKLLLKSGINPTVTVGDSKGWKFNAGEGNKYSAAYNPKTDTVALFRPAAGERNALHEFMHAATLSAMARNGLAAAQMRALFAHVVKTGKLKGMYGMANVDEFIAEAFTNPKFQDKLKAISAPSSSGGVKTAWDWFVRVVRGILGLKQGDHSALSAALEIGVRVMRENMALQNAGGQDIRYNLTEQASNQLHDLFHNDNTFNWLHKSVSTQYHKATVDADFKRVFDIGQKYILDNSRFAMDAAEEAPTLLQKLGSIADVFRSGAKRKDVEAIAGPVFNGTLEKALFTDADLRTRFNLTDAQIALYREFRAGINKSLDDLGVSEMVRIAKSVVGLDVVERAKGAGDLDVATNMLHGALIRDAKEKINQAKSERASMNEGKAISLEQSAELSETLSDDVLKKAGRINQLKQEGYAPLMRFGQFAVDVVETDPVTGEDDRKYFGMYETQQEANKAARALKLAYPLASVKQGPMDTESWKLFGGIDPSSLEVFAEAVGADESSIFQDYLRLTVNNRSALKRLIQRGGIEGFSKDTQRVLAQFVTSNGKLAAKNYHFGDMKKAVMDIPKDKGDVKSEAAKLVKYLQDPAEEAAPLRSYLFMHFLGGSIASALTNMTQPITMTIPYLAQFGGAAKAGAAMIKAGALWKSKKYDPQLAAAMKLAEREGITEPHEIHQLYAESMRGLGRDIRVRKTLRVWGSLFSLAEAFNRNLTFIAAFNMARDAGKADPFADAQKAVEDTQGIYNKGNRPDWARGTIGATVFTFKQFSISYVEFLSRLYKNDKKAFALAMAVMFMGAGAEGWPFAEDLEDLIDTIGQMFGFATNSKQWLRRNAKQVFGETGGDLFRKGVSSIPGMPIDLSSRLGVSNLIPGTAMFKVSEKDKTKDVFEWIGPLGGFAQSAVHGFDVARTGNVAGAARLAAPVAIQNVLKGVDMATFGFYRDMGGRKVVNTDGYDAFAKALGFQPNVVAKESSKIREIQQNIQQARTIESEIADTWAQGIFEKNPDKVKSALSDLREWNAKNPEERISIAPTQISARLKSMQSTREQRFIKSAPKEMRGQVMQELRQ